MKLVGEDMVAFGALVGDQRLNGGGQRRTIARSSCLHQRNEEITSCHRSFACPSLKERSYHGGRPM
jgi:hypothetical protein